MRLLKRSSAANRTKRDKGTKWIVLVDSWKNHSNFDDQANCRGPGLGQTIDIEKFAEQYSTIKPELNQQLHLLYLGVGKVDGLLEADHDLQAVFDKHDVKYVNGDMDDFGHDWNYWRFALADFAASLFKQYDKPVSPC